MLRSGEFSEYCRKVKEDNNCEFYNNLYSEQGKMLVKARKVAQDLEEYGVVEQAAKMEGRQLTMVLAPKKKK